MRKTYALLVLFGLSACAANIVRLEHADAVSTQATAMVKAANSYVADVQARRRQANIALVASDPSCGWGDHVLTDVNWAPPRGFCDVRGVPELSRVSISLRPVSAEALKGLTVAIGGVATYQAALADILEEKPEIAKDGISDAVDKLTTATSDINRIAGQKLIDLGPLTGDSGKAIVDLVGTLVEMQQTNLKVEKVRKLVSQSDNTKLYADLKTALERLTALQDANSTARLRFALESAYASEAGKLDFDARLERVRQIAAASDEDAALRTARLKTMSDVVDKLAASDASLRDALAGKFSPEERRRIARMNRATILNLLSDVAALFPAI